MRHTILSLCLLPLATACRGISVETSHDPRVDFARLRTFDWAAVPPQATTAVDDASLVGLIGSQLEAEGLQKVDRDPDVLVAVHRSLSGRVHTDVWGYTFESGRIRTHEMEEGTLVVDIVDAVTRQTVWRGLASGAFRVDLLPDERRALLQDILQRMFADYPPR